MLMDKPREILKLVRFGDGRFGIYADGELVEVYSANADTWHAMIPIRLWRAFNRIVESRIKLGGSMTKEKETEQELNNRPQLIKGLREHIIDIIHSHVNSTAWAEEEADQILSLIKTNCQEKKE